MGCEAVKADVASVVAELDVAAREERRRAEEARKAAAKREQEAREAEQRAQRLAREREQAEALCRDERNQLAALRSSGRSTPIDFERLLQAAGCEATKIEIVMALAEVKRAAKVREQETREAAERAEREKAERERQEALEAAEAGRRNRLSYSSMSMPFRQCTSSEYSASLSPLKGSCDGNSICLDARTQLPLRVLPRPGRGVYAQMNERSSPASTMPDAFVPLYVFGRRNVTDAGSRNAKGWFHVGRSPRKADGFMKAADVLEWKAAVIASYAHRGGEGNQRKPVIMFKEKRPLEDLLASSNTSDRGNDYYKRLERREVFNEIIAREADALVDIAKTFYLLPVLDHIDLHDVLGIEDTRMLHVAAALPGEGPAGSIQASLVAFIGRATERPQDISAWLVDKDITNFNRTSVKVHALLTPADLNQLVLSLRVLIEAHELGKLTGEMYFKSLQSVVYTAALDWNISQTQTLAESPLMPAWIAAVPYRSQITSLRFSDFEEMTADSRQRLQRTLRDLVSTYREILDRHGSWTLINGSTCMYPLAVDKLP